MPQPNPQLARRRRPRRLRSTRSSGSWSTHRRNPDPDRVGCSRWQRFGDDDAGDASDEQYLRSVIHELAHIDDRTSAPVSGSFSTGDRQCYGDVLAGDESGPDDLAELMCWAMSRSPRRAGQLNVCDGLFSSRRMDDVGEHRAIELVYFNSDSASAVVGDCIENITKACPTPRGIRRWRREVAPVVADGHGSALVDRDNCEWEGGGRYGRRFRRTIAIAHATEVRVGAHPSFSSSCDWLYRRVPARLGGAGAGRRKSDP